MESSASVSPSCDQGKVAVEDGMSSTDVNRNTALDSTVTTFATGTRVSETVRLHPSEDNSNKILTGPANASQLLAAAASKVRDRLKAKGSINVDMTISQPILFDGTATLGNGITSGNTSATTLTTRVSFTSKTTMSTVSDGLNSESSAIKTSSRHGIRMVSPHAERSITSTTNPTTEVVTVPYLWQREIDGSGVFYFSPTGDKLKSLPEIKTYLLEEGTCKCGLPCPFHVEALFSFDKCKGSKEWSLAEMDQLDVNVIKKCCQVKHIKSHAASTMCSKYTSPLKKITATKRKCNRSKSSATDISPSRYSPAAEYKGKLVSELIAQKPAVSGAVSSQALSVDIHNRTHSQAKIHTHHTHGMASYHLPLPADYGKNMMSPPLCVPGDSVVRHPMPTQRMISPNHPHSPSPGSMQPGNGGYVPYPGMPPGVLHTPSVYPPRAYFVQSGPPPVGHHPGVLHGPPHPGYYPPVHPVLYQRHPIPPGYHQPAPIWQQKPIKTESRKKARRLSSASSTDGNSDTGYQSELSSPVCLSPSKKSTVVAKEKSTSEETTAIATEEGINTTATISQSIPTPVSITESSSKSKSTTSAATSNAHVNTKINSSQVTMHPSMHIMQPGMRSEAPFREAAMFSYGHPPPNIIYRGMPPPLYGPSQPGYYQFVGPYPPRYSPYVAHSSPDMLRERTAPVTSQESISSHNNYAADNRKKPESPQPNDKPNSKAEIVMTNGVKPNPPSPSERQKLPVTREPSPSRLAQLPVSSHLHNQQTLNRMHRPMTRFISPTQMFYRHQHPSMVGPGHAGYYPTHHLSTPVGYPPYLPQTGAPVYYPHSPPLSPPSKKRRKRSKPKSDESLSAHLHQQTVEGMEDISKIPSTSAENPSSQINGMMPEKSTVKLAAIDTMLSKTNDTNPDGLTER